MDFIRPIPTFETEHNFILHIVDVFTNFSLLRPIENKEAVTIAKELWKTICDFGPPKIIQSDQGTEFVNYVLNVLIKLYKIDRKLTMLYHPKANELVKRKNKDATLILNKLIDGTTNHWNEFIPLVQFSMNRIINNKTQSTPAALMFARRFNDLKDYREITLKLQQLAEPLISRIKEFQQTTLLAIRQLEDYY